MPQRSPLLPASSYAHASASGTSSTPPSTSWQKCWWLLRSSQWRRLLSSWWTWAFSRPSPVHPTTARTCCSHDHGHVCSVCTATIAVNAPAAAEGVSVPAAALDVKAAQEPTFDERAAWLTKRGLLNPSEGLSEEQVVRRYNALSKCTFGNSVGEESRCDFLRHLLPCEACLAAK